MGEELKYFEVTLDTRLTFEAYFNHLATKVTRVAALLSHHLPNIDRPDENVRQIYTCILRSMTVRPFIPDTKSK